MRRKPMLFVVTLTIFLALTMFCVAAEGKLSVSQLFDHATYDNARMIPANMQHRAYLQAGKPLYTVMYKVMYH